MGEVIEKKMKSSGYERELVYELTLYRDLSIKIHLLDRYHTLSPSVHHFLAYSVRMLYRPITHACV